MNQATVALLVLILGLMGLVFWEVQTTGGLVPPVMHTAQILLSMALLGLSLWLLNLQRQWSQSSLQETDLLKEQVSAKSSRLDAVNRQITDIMEVSPDLVWVKDLNGVFQSCNLPFARYLGFEINQILGKTDFDLVRPEQAQSFREHDRQTLATCKATIVEELHTSASGDLPLLLEITKNPVWDAVGKLTGVQGIGRDITKRRAAENALQAANVQLRMLDLCIARLNEVVLITEAEPFDRPGPRIVFVNDAFERMTGYSRAEVLGMSPRLLQGPKTQRSELDRVRRALTAWQSVHVELINYKKNGDEYWAEIDIVPVPGDRGWFTHWIGVQRDITARKAAEAEMLQICDRALEASRLKSEFMSSISHEMRTPMNVVIGMATLLLGTELSPKQKMFVNHIASAGQDYLQVIDKSLDFSKLESGKLALDCLPFELRPMLLACELLITTKAQAKKIEFHSRLDANLPQQLMGDEHRLQQCLLILLDNAVKFTASGRIELVVQGVAGEGAAALLRFEVHDSGIGLTDVVRERLFHPFVQGDGSTTRSYGGIGLGLIICQQLVTLMQGRIGVDSSAGQGCRFWFELPLRATP